MARIAVGGVAMALEVHGNHLVGLGQPGDHRSETRLGVQHPAVQHDERRARLDLVIEVDAIDRCALAIHRWPVPFRLVCMSDAADSRNSSNRPAHCVVSSGGPRLRLRAISIPAPTPLTGAGRISSTGTRSGVSDHVASRPSSRCAAVAPVRSALGCGGRTRRRFLRPVRQPGGAASARRGRSGFVPCGSSCQIHHSYGAVWG